MPKSKLRNLEYYMNAETNRNPEFNLFDEWEYLNYFRLEEELYE